MNHAKKEKLIEMISNMFFIEKRWIETYNAYTAEKDEELGALKAHPSFGGMSR